MKEKICALVRQTWYETAKKNLQQADRLRFYEMCFEYEFYGHEPDEDAPFAARLLFDMVRNDIDAYKNKAAARAERSRQNGLRGGRPKVTPINSEQENPVGLDETQKTCNTLHNTTPHNTTQQKETDVENEDTHMFFNICLLFFEKGCSDPCGEANTFWHYYEAMGWKTKGGGEVVDRFALAKAWRLGDCSRSAMRKRVDWAKALHLANATETCLISEFVDMVKDGSANRVDITFQTQQPAMIFEKNYVQRIASKWLPVDQDGKYFALTYHALQQYL